MTTITELETRLADAERASIAAQMKHRAPKYIRPLVATVIALRRQLEAAKSAPSVGAASVGVVGASYAPTTGLDRLFEVGAQVDADYDAEG